MAPNKIYVGNIPSSARNSELKELFEKFGKVVECDILKDFGFVHMDDLSDAKAAIAGLNDILWKGSRIRVEISTTKTNKGEPSQRRKLRGYDSRRPYPDRYPMRGSSREPPMRPSSHRDYPYPPYSPPHYRSSRDLPRGPGGPIRDSRYEPPNGRYMSDRDRDRDRDRPYSDAYDHRDRYGPPPFRNSGGVEMRDYRYRNDPVPDHYHMRGGHLPPPEPHHLPPRIHDSYYRRGPTPVQMPPSRYDYERDRERDRSRDKERGRERERDRDRERERYRASSPPSSSSSSSSSRKKYSSKKK